MFLSAQFAFHLGFEQVNIITIDTDIAILAIYFQSILDGKIYLEFGTSTRIQLFDILANTMDDRLIHSLPGIHALSGCDSTSCFEGKGKVKILKLIQSDDDFITAAALLGAAETLKG